jgi:hypothetical protein
MGDVVESKSPTSAWVSLTHRPDGRGPYGLKAECKDGRASSQGEDDGNNKRDGRGERSDMSPATEVIHIFRDSRTILDAQFRERWLIIMPRTLLVTPSHEERAIVRE